RRDTAQDKRLPARALGVLVYLFSKPDDWEPTVDDICKRFEDIGREQAYRIINETLIPLGYARRVCERENGRVVQWITEIYETPDAENQQLETPDAGFQDVEIQDVALPDAGYQMLKTSTIQINRVQNTEDKLQKEQSTDVARMKPRQRPKVCDEQLLVE